MTSSSSPPLQLHQLHPIEALLALLLTSAAALHQLISEPPRLRRRRSTMNELAAKLMTRVETAFGTAPARDYSILDPVRLPEEYAPLESLTVRNLQRIARERGIRSVDGRALKYCRKLRLVEVLSND